VGADQLLACIDQLGNEPAAQAPPAPATNTRITCLLLSLSRGGGGRRLELLLEGATWPAEE
jgi:hypothetical protein